MPNETQIKKEPSGLRKRYIIRFIGRIIVLVIATLLFFFKRDEFDVLEGFNFFRKFSLFHLLWGIWVVDMLLQLIPVKNHISLGSQKHLRYHFQMAKERINIPALKKYIASITRSAYKVMILWVALIAVIAGFYYTGVFTKAHLLMISVLFYVFDLVCVLIWCPFRLIMGNKCCTTCRIFNWDHFMMFSPVIFAGGFYAISLFSLAMVDFFVWEICVLLYPERFWEGSNASLQCSECTDKLCTQYCQKLRKSNSAKEIIFPDKKSKNAENDEEGK